MSEHFASIVKTEEIIELTIGGLSTLHRLSPSGSNTTSEALCESIDFAISATASRRADIKFLSRRGCETCKVISEIHNQAKFSASNNHITEDPFTICFV